MDDIVKVVRGDGPVILGMPHGGTLMDSDLTVRLTPEHGMKLADADWHIARVYDGLLPDATTVAAQFHRYVIDANRDPEGTSLYPGQNTTDLVPLRDFDGEAIWREGQEPTDAEISERLERYHRPYHAALEAEIERVKVRHGFAILYDCHSIRPFAPFLFEGRLPDFNIGDNDGTTCAPAITRAVAGVCEAYCAKSRKQWVVNGRFKGGWTTRHYGRPADNVHAIQMELSQELYMDTSPPYRFDEEAADILRPVLADALAAIVAVPQSGELA